MEYAFSILMFIFAGALLLYAGLLALTRDIRMVSRSYAAQVKDPKRYALQFAKLLAIVAAAPVLAGVAGLYLRGFYLGIAAVGCFVGCIGLGIHLVKLDV